jgi:hypothetical protein
VPPLDTAPVVCGCDATTDPSRAAAWEAGVSVAHYGECGSQCGGPPGFACFPGELYPRACDAVFAGTDVAGCPIDGACAAP